MKSHARKMGDPKRLDLTSIKDEILASPLVLACHLQVASSQESYAKFTSQLRSRRRSQSPNVRTMLTSQPPLGDKTSLLKATQQRLKKNAQFRNYSVECDERPINKACCLAIILLE